MLSDKGELLLVRATPEGYQVKSSFTVGEGTYWSVPTLYEGHLYLRDQQSIQVFKVKA